MRFFKPESLADGARPLPPTKEEELRRACEDARLPAAVTEEVVTAACLIQSALEHGAAERLGVHYTDEAAQPHRQALWDKHNAFHGDPLTVAAKVT